MTTVFSEMAPKKRLTTYGKSSRKRLPSFPHFSQIENKRPAPEAANGNATSTKRPQTLPSRDTTASIDVFDFPSSDDERAPPSAHGKRKIGVSRETTPAKKSRIQQPSMPLRRQDSKARTTKASQPVLISKKTENKTIITPKMLSQSALGMNAVRSTERIVKKDAPKQGPPLPTQSLASRPIKDTKQVKSTTLVDRMATVALATPRKAMGKSTTPDVDAIMSTPSPASIKSAVSISPRGKRMWQGLLNGTDSSKPLSFERKAVPRAKKPRLIDTLMEQQEDSDDSGSECEHLESQQKSSQLDSQPEEISNSQWETRHQEQTIDVVPALSAGAIIQTAGPRTYASQRSFLSESVQDFESQLMEMPLESAPTGRRQGRGGIPSLKPLESLHEAEDDAPGVAIRSVHELRLAGAKSHFVDGVENLLSDIGVPQAKPSSSRRSGLIDLATKLIRDGYRKQFLENGLEHRLFLHLGQETDVVSGFLMVSILLIVLSESANSLTIEQLRRQGISRLLVRLLEVQNSISRISKERSSNMSRSAQSLLNEYQTLLLQSELWKEQNLTNVSPRRMALRCLELMVKQIREIGNASDIISKEMISKLFGIVEKSAAKTLHERSKDKDFQLALSTLEWDSKKGMSGDVSAWTSTYLPLLSDLALETLSQKEMFLQVEEDGLDCHLTIFELICSVTQGNEEAANVFSSPRFIGTLAKAVVAVFKRMSGDLLENERHVALALLMTLTAMMMHIVESSQPARQSFDDLEDTENDSLAAMVQIFNEREITSSQAVDIDTVVENGAFAFLTFTLGYLCSELGIRERVAVQLSEKSLTQLASAAEGAVTLFKAADELKMAEGSPAYASEEQYKRLESMINNLLV